ncbi:MAG: ABC transporter ATP-binding protein [Spirochaetales bacterium]|uniref:ABC transporter ATP-binding protein n=1 Tax=Candidatus Thalassospirochaeta sargassi TaxID=3119039 RepID=A0AAJ1MLT4_9SPIO|nr:ABC transporter ATP-binding protein [Spirochaetales bacterium]
MMLQIKDLKVRYGNIEALHGLNFEIDRGEIVTLIGANGAGKTSTLLSLSRLAPPDAPTVFEGDILFDGESILKTEPHKLVEQKMMALVPEGRHIFGNLSVQENLDLATYAVKEDHQFVQETEDLVYNLFPRLKERQKQRSESLSGGEQQMLAVGRALMTGCKFIMLDEPSMGLAPVLMYEMFRALRELNKNGITILVVEQNAKVALDFATRGYVLDTGEIIASGSSDELRNNKDVQKAYLGG